MLVLPEFAEVLLHPEICKEVKQMPKKEKETKEIKKGKEKEK